MLDEYVNEILTLLGIGTSATSIVSVIIMIIYCARSIAKVIVANKNNNTSVTDQLNAVITELQNQITAIQESTQTSSEQIEEAFENAVIPSTIKVDLSSKVSTVLTECTNTITSQVSDLVSTIATNQVLILKILSQFTHVQKLSEDDQAAIQDAISTESNTLEVKISN